MVDISSAGMESVPFAQGLLQEERVVVAPGDAFGAAGQGLVRISLAAAPEALMTGLQRLCRFVKARAADR